MEDPVAAAFAFTALGANVLATGLLLLFDAGGRALRWYLAFLCALSGWLLSAGVLRMGGSGAWETAYALASLLLPVLFLASAVAKAVHVSRWAPWVVTGLGVLLLPFAAFTLAGASAAGVVEVVWHAVGWGAGSLIHWRSGPRATADGEGGGRAHRLVLAVLLVPSLAVVGSLLLGAQAFFAYVLPLAIIGIHFAIFVGVVRLRFYDIEVRVGRSGEIAGRAGEIERLAAVGELAASVAHEVRNPLTGMRSLAQRIAEEPSDPERWKRYAAVIVEEAGRVDRIVGSLLSLARRPALEPWSGETTRVDALFDDLLLLTTVRGARAGVTVRAARTGIVASAPREALAQALLNLLLNALDHTPHGGVVTLRAEEEEEGIVLRVSDTGPGVPAGERARIFEPFYTGSVDGTGLGLSVVRRIARELGWHLEVADAPGGGAEFIVRIPAPTPRQGQPADAAVTGPVPHAARAAGRGVATSP
jgi:signal transduction histidine kinase